MIKTQNIIEMIKHETTNLGCMTRLILRDTSVESFDF